MNVLLGHLLGTGDDALEPGEWDTLELLAQKPSWRMGDLARALRVDPSTATRAVQRLVHAELAERSRCEHDGRVAFVQLSTVGRTRYEDGMRRRQRVMRELLHGFQPEERAQLADLLGRLVSSLDVFVSHLDHDRDVIARG
jgi:DNA-binding MarR family transcriptional regulator